MNHLFHYTGTLFIVTHDVEVINDQVDTIWHIQHGNIHIFNGHYEEYQKQLRQKTASLEEEIAQLHQQKKETHRALMREQQRNKRVRIHGEKSIEERKWPTIRSSTKLGKGITTGNKRLNQIQEKKSQLLSEIANCYRPDVIMPKFQLTSFQHQKTMPSIRDGVIRYPNTANILSHINFHMEPKERVAICGNNGSGKSTFIKALLNREDIEKVGDWILPPALLILDEITNNLDLETKTHVGQILKHYPGAMIVISHNHRFLKDIHIDTTYTIHQGRLEAQKSSIMLKQNLGR